MFAVFITWLIGFIFVFFTTLSLIIEKDYDINLNLLKSILIISVFSWIVVFVYFVYVIKLIFDKSGKG